MAKKLVLGPILAHLAQIRAASFFVFCCFFQKFALVSHYISWSAIIMYNIKRKNKKSSNFEKT